MNWKTLIRKDRIKVIESNHINFGMWVLTVQIFVQNSTTRHYYELQKPLEYIQH